MLNYSKFVNTKAQHRMGSAKPPVQLPVFTRSVKITKLSHIEGAETDAAATENRAVPLLMHTAVDLDEMQRREDSNKQGDDWMSFFLDMEPGKEPPMPVSTEAFQVGGFALYEFAPASETVTMPPPPEPVSDGPNCLDDIFNELISDDIEFQRTCS